MAKNEKPDQPLDESAIRDEAKAEATDELKKELAKDAEAEAKKTAKALKEQYKAEAKAKLKEEIEAELRAEYEAKLKAKIEKDAKAEAEAELRKDAEAKLEELDDDLWKKDPKAEITRVFRCENPPARESYVTLMQRKKMVDGTELDAVAISKSPNAAHQYVLGEGSVEYATQLKSFRRLEAQGLIKEVAPVQLGVPYIPPAQRKVRELEAKLRQAKIEAGLI